MLFPNAALDQPINAEMDHRETGADSQGEGREVLALLAPRFRQEAME